jgi:hypothetical protein
MATDLNTTATDTHSNRTPGHPIRILAGASAPLLLGPAGAGGQSPRPGRGCAAGGLALAAGMAGQPEKNGQGDDNQGEPTPQLKDLQAV